jgi:hypothetical protein
MIVKACGRAALILATGLFVCFAGPSQAAPGADKATANSKSENATGAPVALDNYAKRGSRHLKKYAHRKSGKAALKSSTDTKAADVADDNGNSSTAIPPAVANANAQLASAEAPADSASAMSAKANTMLLAAADQPADAETQVVSADQLNDVDRALQESRPAAPTLAMASTEAPVVPVLAGSNENSTWDGTSLIGKLFIGFGALLTMASAARMFMA